MPHQDADVRNKNFSEVSLGYTLEDAINEAIEYENDDLTFIVPAKTLAEVTKLIEDNDEQITLNIGKKYILFNLPTASLDEAVKMLPAMRSPTVIPLAQPEWCSVQTVVDQKCLWEVIEKLKAIGAEGILVLNLEKIVL